MKRAQNNEVILMNGSHYRWGLPPAFLLFIFLWVCSFALAGYQMKTDQKSCVQARYLDKRLSVEVRSDPRIYERFSSSMIVWKGKTFDCSWPAGLPRKRVPQLGMRCVVEGTITPLKDSGYDLSLKKQGYCGHLSVKQIYTRSWPSTIKSRLLKVRARLIDEVLADEDPLSSSLLGALIFGYKTDLGSLKDLFSRVGLSHMLAVSGTHYALAAAIILFLFKKLKASRTALIVAGLVFSGVFYVVTGMSVSTLRACLTAVFIAAFFLVKRRIDLLSVIGVIGTTLLLVNPKNATSLSFQLSFLAVIGIALFYASFARGMQTLFSMPRWLVGSLAVWLSAQLLTMPLVIMTFHACSPLSVLSTLVTALLFEGIIVGGVAFFMSSFMAPPIAHAALATSKFLSAVLIEVVVWLARIPGMHVELSHKISTLLATIIGGVGLLIYVYLQEKQAAVTPTKEMSQRAKSIVALIISLAFIAVFFGLVAYEVQRLPHLKFPHKSSDGFYFLNVGQGDATLIKDQGSVMLIDAGPDPLVLKQALADIRVRRVDTLIFTHGHSDHVKGAYAFGRLSGVKRIIVSVGTKNDPDIQAISRRTGAPISEVLAGDKIALPSMSLTVYSPTAPVQDPDNNASCLVVGLDEPPFNAQQPDVVVTGDAEGETLLEILNRLHLSKIGTLKLGHHGSKGSITPQILSKVLIGNVIISVGENSYGHPHWQVIRTLNQFRVPYKRTDQYGTVFMRSMAQ